MSQGSVTSGNPTGGNPNSLNVYEAYPVDRVGVPVDPGMSPRTYRRAVRLVVLAILALFGLALVWLPAAYILGAVIAIPLTLNIKADLRGTWPI